MITVKISELLNGYDALRKVGNMTSFAIPIQFKFRVSLLIKNITNYIDLYSQQLETLINSYEIRIKDNQFKCDDYNKLQEFLKQKDELEQMIVEIDNEKIQFDKSINDLSANDLLNLNPFFDYSELL